MKSETLNLCGPCLCVALCHTKLTRDLYISHVTSTFVISLVLLRCRLKQWEVSRTRNIVHSMQVKSIVERAANWRLRMNHQHTILMVEDFLFVCKICESHELIWLWITLIIIKGPQFLFKLLVLFKWVDKF